MKKLSTHTIGVYLLRTGLAGVFLWFGFSQLFDTASWTSWVPLWATELSGLSFETIVRINGVFEVLGGACIAIGLGTRIVATLLGIHLAVITFDIGFNSIGVRDFGLMMATFALAFLGETPQKKEHSAGIELEEK